MSDESFKLCVHGLKITFYSYNNKANAMATPQYSDLFTYCIFVGIHDWCTVSYKNVTLLKDLCGKKAGTTLGEIRLNMTNGKWTVPRGESSKGKPEEETETEAKTLVEFKGKHTRFQDSDDENVIWLGNEGFELPLPSNPKAWRTKLEDKTKVLDKGESSKTGVVTLKLYEHKRKLFKPDSSIKEYVIKYILSHVNGTLVEETTGPRGELLVTLRSPESEQIPKNVLLPFTVCTARNRSRTCYYKTA